LQDIFASRLRLMKSRDNKVPGLHVVRVGKHPKSTNAVVALFG